MGRIDADLRRSRRAFGDFTLVKGGRVSVGKRGVREGGEERPARGAEVAETTQLPLALERDSVRVRGRALGGADIYKVTKN